VQGAIRTDFILSAEIMALTLASIPAEAGFAERAAVLAIVGVGVTMAVYGAVALIVKADDFGVHLATRQTVTPLGPASQALGRGIVTAMPGFLKLLTVVGTLAMLWVGGGILIHGLVGRVGPVAEPDRHLARALREATPVRPRQVEPARQHDAHRLMRHAEAAHRQRRVVGARRAAADHHRVMAGPQRVAPAAARRGAGDPAAFAGCGGDPAVEAGGEFQRQQRPARA
jgi:hypothetical protein